MVEVLAAAGWIVAATGWALWYSQRERHKMITRHAEHRVLDVKDYMKALQTFIERDAFEERKATSEQTVVDPEAEAQAQVEEDDLNRVVNYVKRVARKAGRDISDKQARDEAERILDEHKSRTSPGF